MPEPPAQVKELADRFEQKGTERSDLCLCKTRLQREIDATDRQIDQLVYELYGVTEEEIKVVEEATQR